MSRYYLRINDSSGLSIRFVESSDSVDLQRRVRAELADLAAKIPGGNLVLCNLSGEGDGPNYTVELQAMPANVTSPPGAAVVYPSGADISGAVPGVVIPLAGVTATCYMAQLPDHISDERIRALVASGLTTATDYFDEMIAGGSKGLRVMGLILHAPTQ